MAAVCFSVYKYTRNSLPPGGSEQLQGEGTHSEKQLNETNQQLNVRISELQEELRVISEERDRLKDDKAQLLYMVEKLQQQSVQAAASGEEGGFSEKVMRSWLVRLSELRHTKSPETAVSRDAYLKEVNEIIRGLKEDFTDDTFIMDIGYVKASSRVKNDITAAQKKLDDIITYLRAYNYSAD
jgi:hypothetical protein